MKSIIELAKNNLSMRASKTVTGKSEIGKKTVGGLNSNSADGGKCIVRIQLWV